MSIREPRSCSCPKCSVRRASGQIGAVITRVTSGEVGAEEIGCDFATSDGVGRVHLLVVRGEVFEQHLRPVLDRLEVRHPRELEP